MGCSAVATEVLSDLPLARRRRGLVRRRRTSAARGARDSLRDEGDLFTSDPRARRRPGADDHRRVQAGAFDFLRDDSDREELLYAPTPRATSRGDRGAKGSHEPHRMRDPRLSRDGDVPRGESDDSYRRVLRELRRVENACTARQFGLLNYRLADHLYLFTPSARSVAELPESRGLVEASGMCLRHPMPTTPTPCRFANGFPAPPSTRPDYLRPLRNIAVAASVFAARPRSGIYPDPSVMLARCARDRYLGARAPIVRRPGRQVLILVTGVRIP